MSSGGRQRAEIPRTRVEKSDEAGADRADRAGRHWRRRPVQSPYSPICTTPPTLVTPCPKPPCVTPTPTAPSTTTPTPSGTTPTTPTSTTAAPPESPSLIDAPSSVNEGNTFSLAAPNMIGDLLYSSRSINYGFNRINGNSSTLGLGSTSIVNAAVAENNSPLPEDRVYFRYNYFNSSQSVTGIANQPYAPFPGNPANNQVYIYPSETKHYDTNLYTFGGEKTFFDGSMSVEVRLPIVSTLSPSNVISVGNITGPATYTDPSTGRVVTKDLSGNNLFGVQATPGETLGRDNTYFDNMMVILKGLYYQSADRRLALSAGMGFGIPTAPDTHLSVVDYTGTLGQTASFQQLRNFTIANETWALSPFLAALYTPTERFFAQGFLEVEVPLNNSTVTYSDRYTVEKTRIRS